MELKPKSAKERLIMLFDKIDAKAAEAAIRRITEINIEDAEFSDYCLGIQSCNGMPIGEPKPTPITLHLSTGGGNCYCALALYDVVASSETPVEISCSGRVMSAGIVVLLASKVRRAYKNTIFMIHQVSCMNAGTVQELEESVEAVKQLNDRIFEIIAHNSKITRCQLNSIKQSKRDWYFTAKEAFDMGIVTEIIDEPLIRNCSIN